MHKARKKIPVFQVTLEKNNGVSRSKKIFFLTFLLNINTSETRFTGFPSLTWCNIAALERTSTLRV